MANFKFRFQTLLNLKKNLEKNIQNDLGVALRKLKAEEMCLSEMEQNRDQYIKDYRKKVSGGINPEEIMRLKYYIDDFRRKIAFQQSKVNLEKENVDKIREKLIQVMREKKILEKLKQRALIEYRKEENRKEQVLIDELVSFKYNMGD